MFDFTKINTAEYVRQIIEAATTDRPSTVEFLLVEYGTKAYGQARQDAADALAKMFPRTANIG